MQFCAGGTEEIDLRISTANQEAEHNALLK